MQPYGVGQMCVNRDMEGAEISLKALDRRLRSETIWNEMDEGGRGYIFRRITPRLSEG